jgi:hypothetical protein
VPVMHHADARIDKQKGVLISSTPDVDKLSPGGPEDSREASSTATTIRSTTTTSGTTPPTEPLVS